MRISLDFETASLLNLKQTGAWKYAQDPSTMILCMAWAIEGEEPSIWFPGSPLPTRLLIALHEGATVVAWNAHFERSIWLHVGPRYGLPPVPLERFECTMARGMLWGFPGALDKAAKIAGAGVEKDKAGHKLMLRMSKPLKYADDGTPVWDHGPDKLERLGAYCQQDVRAERAVADTLPPMPAFERQLWLLDQRMNERGLRLDPFLVDKLWALSNEGLRGINAEVAALTEGRVPRITLRGKLVAELARTGLIVKSLGKGVLPAILADELHDCQRELLRLWQRGTKTSTKKLNAMLRSVCNDGRCRGLVQYAGAIRTARWAGRLVQIQNFPRPIKDFPGSWAVREILAGITSEGVELTFGGTLDVVSSLLRSCFIPDPGHIFCVVDYSGIEARVVAWLAGHEEALAVFRRGEDIYVYAAAQQGSNDRQFGKVLVLACGYGMGPLKFQATALGYGLVMSTQQCVDAVYGWRKANQPIRDLWYEYDEAVRKVIKEGSEVPIKIGPVSFRMAKSNGALAGAMIMRLPSGREIIYHNAHLAKVRTKIIDEEGNESIEVQIKIAYEGIFMGKWCKITTWGGKLVENATQAVARDLLAEVMLRLDAKGVPLDTTIHDEIIAEPTIAEGEATLALMKSEMSIPPAWAVGLPLNAEGKPLSRYGKG